MTIKQIKSDISISVFSRELGKVLYFFENLWLSNTLEEDKKIEIFENIQKYLSEYRFNLFDTENYMEILEEIFHVLIQEETEFEEFEEFFEEVESYSDQSIGGIFYRPSKEADSKQIEKLIFESAKEAASVKIPLGIALYFTERIWPQIVFGKFVHIITDEAQKDIIITVEKDVLDFFWKEKSVEIFEGYLGDILVANYFAGGVERLAISVKDNKKEDVIFEIS